MEEHNPDCNPDWTPKVAYRVYACSECGHEVAIQTNHTGTVHAQRCGGTCRQIMNPHTARERVLPAYTRHVYKQEVTQ